MMAYEIPQCSLYVSRPVGLPSKALGPVMVVEFYPHPWDKDSRFLSPYPRGLIMIEDRLNALRAELERRDLGGFIIPLTDEHMSEYVGDYAQRLGYMTGFGGSAGMAIVMADRAAIFTDGRYTLQVRDQVDGDLYAYEQWENDGPVRWLAAHADIGNRIGYDPELATRPWVEKLSAAVARGGASLVSTTTNPIDAIWADQPQPSLAPIVVHDMAFAGETSTSKRARLAADLQSAGIDAAPIAMLDSVAWLFNIRGVDVKNTPVPRAFAMLHNDGSAVLYTDLEKVDATVKAHLGDDVDVQPRENFYPALAALSGKSVLFDAGSHNALIHQKLVAAGAKLVAMADPAILAKAIKNSVEVEGAFAAHRRDGVAVTQFLAWLDREAPKGDLDELACVDKLADFRQQINMLQDASFDTISGAGPNGAYAHYRVSAETNRKLEPGGMYLCDSGGQYLDGTTDITRTIAVSDADAQMKRHYTLVLKGHIALATTIFAPGTTGQMLDSIARAPLWAEGLDYDHGTGHGVGSYLGVHEGPQRIAKHGSDVPLEPGMLLSNEPGYYREGAYGIRIENLVQVVKVSAAHFERPMYGFETMTMAPLARKLIDIDLLTDAELGWVNRYHGKVCAALEPQMNGDDLIWMQEQTAPLG